MPNNELEFLTTAALLHDIGKFAQRAGMPCSTGLEQEYCPGGKTHRHVLYTDYFIEKVLPLPPEMECERSRLARLASSHHRPDSGSPEEVVLSRADRLSSGGDRVEGESGGDMRTSRLESVFNVISLTDRPRKEMRYGLLPIDDPAAIFPVDAQAASATNYATLWEGFEKELSLLPLKNGVRRYLASLRSLLERWTWCIPSSTWKTRADISLYDHAWTTASIAQALHANGTPDNDGLILFGGEFSGIQKFIFSAGDRADKGAGKLLRARSFLVQMLSRSIWSALLDRCGLLDTARIMDAGGKFLLLLPSTDKVRTLLDGIIEETERHLLETYHGVLRIQFASLEIQAADLEMKSFQHCFDDFERKLELAKLSPCSASIKKGMPARLHFQSSDYAALGACDSCGLAPAATEDGEGHCLCRTCHALITEIGRRLPTARYARLSRPTPGSALGYPLFAGTRLTLHADMPEPDASTASILSFNDDCRCDCLPVAGHMPAVTAGEIDQWKQEGRFGTDETGRLADDGVAIVPGAPKTFSMLAATARIPTRTGWRSIPMLAACKADVDNLGLIFSLGFGQDEQRMLSVSRLAGLSRMMHRFFSAWLIRLVEKEFPDIYVVFAGGDDLFVIGPWSEAIRFAERMRSEFTRFTGGNPDVTISAGLPLMKPGLPVFTIRSMAEELLDAAKARNEGGHAKDAVSLFGATIGWDGLREQLGLGERLEALSLDGAVTQGLIRRMLGYSRECAAFRKGDIASGLYMSHASYDMQRNCDVRRLGSDDLKWLMSLPHQESFASAACGITWSLYRTRRS